MSLPQAAHDRGARAERMAALAVHLHEVAPARLGPLEQAHLVGALSSAARCDLTLAATRRWAASRRLDPDAVAAWALERGVVCDCELSRLLSERGR